MVPPPVSKTKLNEFYKLSRRYKKNSMKSNRRKNISAAKGEYIIDQLLCDEVNHLGNTCYLVKWMCCDIPSWVEASEVPSAVRIEYYQQGQVTVEAYHALCDHLQIREPRN